MKRLLSLIMALVIVFFSTSSVLASGKEINNYKTNPDSERICGKLRELGFTQDQISVMGDATKESIANDESVKKLISFEKSSLKSLSNTSLKNSSSLSSPSIPLSGTISTSDLTSNVIAVELADIGGKPAVRIYNDFKWISRPFWTLTDHIAIVWTPGWYANSYDMKVTWKTDASHSYNMYGDDYEVLRSAGIAWDYDIQNTMFSYGTPSGYALVNLVLNDSTLPAYSYSSTQSKYIHDMITPNVSISISPADGGGILPGISLGGDSTNDVATRSTSWYNADIFD